MILSQRKAHFLSSIALACLVPLLFFIGVIFRPSYGIVNESVQPLFTISGVSSAVEKNANTQIDSTQLNDGKIQLMVNTFTTLTRGTKFIILEVEPTKTLKIPDPLLYWQAGTEKPTQLSEDAILLGSLAGTSRRSFILPSQASGQKGQLIIFSQGYKMIEGTMLFQSF